MNDEEKIMSAAKKLFRDELMSFFDANPFKYAQPMMKIMHQ